MDQDQESLSEFCYRQAALETLVPIHRQVGYLSLLALSLLVAEGPLPPLQGALQAVVLVLVQQDVRSFHIRVHQRQRRHATYWVVQNPWVRDYWLGVLVAYCYPMRAVSGLKCSE